MANQTSVQIIPCGALSSRLSGSGELTWLLLAAAQQAVPSRPRRVAVPMHSVLVETPAGRLLWDTCAPRDWASRWPLDLRKFMTYEDATDEEYLDARLGALGLSATDIDYVVLSHLHFDHAGNAGMFRGSGAKLVCSEAELAAVHHSAVADPAYVQDDFRDLPFETVDGDEMILPGVTLLQTPGHTPGSMSMQVDLQDSGTLLFVADAIYYGGQYEVGSGARPVVDDLEQWYGTVGKIRRRAEATNARVVFGHDANQIRQLKVAPARYT